LWPTTTANVNDLGQKPCPPRFAVLAIYVCYLHFSYRDEMHCKKYEKQPAGNLHVSKKLKNYEAAKLKIFVR